MNDAEKALKRLKQAESLRRGGKTTVTDGLTDVARFFGFVPDESSEMGEVLLDYERTIADRDKEIARLREENSELRDQLVSLRSFATWIIALDDPNNPTAAMERNQATLTNIIDRARKANSR